MCIFHVASAVKVIQHITSKSVIDWHGDPIEKESSIQMISIQIRTYFTIAFIQIDTWTRVFSHSI